MMKVKESRKTTKKLKEILTVLLLAGVIGTVTVTPIHVNAEIVEEDVEREGEPEYEDNNQPVDNPQDADAQVDNSNGGNPNENNNNNNDNNNNNNNNGNNDPTDPNYDPTKDDSIDANDPKIKKVKDEWDYKNDDIPKTGTNSPFKYILLGSGTALMAYFVIAARKRFRTKGKTLSLTKKVDK